jgi:hypothetical protein
VANPPLSVDEQQMITRPFGGRALAMAKPIPAVEPVTSASLFSSWRFMIELFCRPAAVHGERLARDE